jgi:hypothetical protein
VFEINNAIELNQKQPPRLLAEQFVKEESLQKKLSLFPIEK